MDWFTVNQSDLEKIKDWLDLDYRMKELYFASPNRRSTRTIRLEYGQVKKVFIQKPMTVKSTVEVNLGVLQRKKYLRMNRNFWRRYMRLNLDYWKVDGLFKINNQFLNQVYSHECCGWWGICCIWVIKMNWRLVLLIIFILEGIYYLTNRFLFNRTFKEIKFWEWIIVIMIIPLIFGYLYIKQETL